LTIVPRGEAFLPNYTAKKLTDLYHRERNAKAKIRLLAAIFRKEGKTYDEIGLTLKYPLTTIRDWLSLIHIEGMSRKSDIKQTGKPKRLTDEQIQKLKPILLKSPEEQDFKFTMWTTKLVIQLIKKLYDVSYKPLQVRRILHRLDLSCQKPRPTHKKASKKAQEDFKKTSEKESNHTQKMDMRSYFWTKASSR
jgi:transposase